MRLIKGVAWIFLAALSLVLSACASENGGPRPLSEGPPRPQKQEGPDSRGGPSDHGPDGKGQKGPPAAAVLSGEAFGIVESLEADKLVLAGERGRSTYLLSSQTRVLKSVELDAAALLQGQDLDIRAYQSVEGILEAGDVLIRSNPPLPDLRENAKPEERPKTDGPVFLSGRLSSLEDATLSLKVSSTGGLLSKNVAVLLTDDTKIRQLVQTDRGDVGKGSPVRLKITKTMSSPFPLVDELEILPEGRGPGSPEAHRF